VEGLHLEEILIDLAAKTLLDRVLAGKTDGGRHDSWSTDLRKRVAEIQDSEIRDAVRPRVEEALAQVLQPTNHLGEPKGDAKTLSGMIVEEATSLLTRRDTPHARYEEGRSLAQSIVAKEVDRAFRVELTKAVEEAKAEVRTAVRDNAAELISDIVARMKD